MSLRVVRPGLLTSVQDLGRYGLQHLGVVPGGAMDTVAHRIANALVGNPEDAATLECTVLGPTLLLECDSLLALYGAEFDTKADGRALPRNRPWLIKAGTTLAIGAASRGTRACLAIAGGFDVPEVLGSRSTYLPAAFGGFAGRAVKAGDRLPGVADLAERSAARFARIADRAAAFAAAASGNIRNSGSPGSTTVRTVRWSARDLSLPSAGAMTVRVTQGRHHDQFDDASRAAFFAHDWRVSPTSNRMGYRLEGPLLTRTRPVDILSEPTCLGTVQVPNDGTPIALMADRQTTGGYPKIAEIAGADIPGLAQLAPGGSVRFTACSLEDAEAARRAADRQLQELLRAIESNYGRSTTGD